MTKFEDRWYQSECSDAMLSSLDDEACKPVVAIPTAGGKTVILSLFIQKYLKLHPHDQILVLSHTKKIIEQDIAALESFFPEKDIGAYSSGLGRKEHKQITVGGIQSVINNPKLFMWTNLVIVDEVHKVSHKNEGSYRKLLDGMQARLTGLSATVFRTGHGYIYEGKGTLFNKLAYDLTSIQNYNRLVEEGYLAKLLPVAPKTQLDSDSVKKTGGEFNLKALSDEHDHMAITRAALEEAMYYGKNYKHWLVFAIDISHADNITKELNRLGVSAVAVHSQMKGDEDQALRDFSDSKIRAVVSVEKITTGFDEPKIDMIIMLRPTMSAILHVQMAGRGTRPYPGKDHCLFLDYAGNTERLGPINDPTIPKKPGEKKGQAPCKKCPKCRSINATAARNCIVCGFEFQFIKGAGLTMESSKEEIVKKESWKPESKEKWLNVSRVMYNIHHKVGKPPSLLITYQCGVTRVKEWILVEHPGYAGAQARHKLEYRGYYSTMTTYEVFKHKHKLRVPKQILVDYGSKFPSVNNCKF